MAAGVVAWLTARIVPAARRPGWLRGGIGELIAAVVAAVAAGVGATALDFGGWKELDWRAGLFAYLTGFAAAGVFRLVTFLRGASPRMIESDPRRPQ